MATVCAGTLALMDAGIKIKAPVSGIAMGMIAEGGKVAILSDILGDEDALGDMDFKVTGTAKGITGCQMDIKIDGLPYEMLEKALIQAKEGRLHILGEMSKALAEPRADLKPSRTKNGRDCNRQKLHWCGDRPWRKDHSGHSSTYRHYYQHRRSG